MKLKWILVGEWELEDGSQAKIWFLEGGDTFDGPHYARITVASFEPVTGKPRLATGTFEVSQFVHR